MPNPCPACASSDVTEVESIATADVAAGWGRESAESARLILAGVSAGETPERFAMVRCGACGLEFADPMFAADERWYAEQERYGERWEFGQCLADVARLVPGRPARIFEVGCGEGHFLARAAAAGHAAAGIDFNAKAIAAARAKGVDATVADLSAVDPGNPPDLFVLFHVIEHLTDPAGLFTELAGHARAGARVCFSCPGPRRYTTSLLPDRQLGKRDLFDYPPLHQTRWCESAAAALLKRTGWRLAEYREEPFGRRGVATAVADVEAARAGRPFAQLPRRTRQLRIATTLLRQLPASLRLRGMSMYVIGERVAA
jgi:SAM-dependent methyltransferase